jgi:mRNA interferase MazF
MARFVKGDVVVVPFPFSDLTQTKRRPALVVTTLEGNDLILCQITSQMIRDQYSTTLESDDFNSGGLNKSRIVYLLLSKKSFSIKQVSSNQKN